MEQLSLIPKVFLLLRWCCRYIGSIVLAGVLFNVLTIVLSYVFSASMIPPEFAERLQTKRVKEGDSVRFTVRVRGKPPPEISWYREGSQIVSSPDFEILQEGDLHSLYIPEVFYEDSGKFSVRAENRAGTQECTAELRVEGELSHQIVIFAGLFFSHCSVINNAAYNVYCYRFLHMDRNLCISKCPMSCNLYTL